MSLWNKFFGSNEREVARLRPLVDRINRLEPDCDRLQAGDFSARTKQLRDRVKSGASLNEVLPEAFALVRAASKRVLGLRHFDVQLVGGIVLHQGKISEMKTGEGKTLVATLPLYLAALTGRGAHLVTVNDYLARRDAQWMGPIYHFLGLSVGIIQNLGISYLYDPHHKVDETTTTQDPSAVDMENLRPCTRKEAYQADVTYGTNNEFGFDYLRDNMAGDPSQLVQRELHFAIVDEVDSILIDEARTPLIISAPAEESTSLYERYSQVVAQLTKDRDYTVDEKQRSVALTPEGIGRVEKIVGIANFYDPNNIAQVHHLEEALKAYALFVRDRDYVVKEGEVIIVDEFTGRLMPGRRFSEGLHQAIEAKEKVEVKRESDTLATISFQNLFRLYERLAGMTGTAATEAEEFYKIYKLEVVEVPTNLPMIRNDRNDRIYKNEEGKFQAAAEHIQALQEKGQPVLVGTISIEKSERLSKILKSIGVKHEVLNAKNHAREAKIIAQAGRRGAVTVATNMAGRGVDIILGGAPLEKEKSAEIVKLNGLFVIGTERHEARRIDNQLRGRSGRQGDPGESMFYVSMEDDLMRIFGGDRLKNIMSRLGLPDGQPIQHKIISRSIESAQRRVEGHNFDIRKHLVEYDDVMNKHREVIYKKRKRILMLDPKTDNWLHEEIIGLFSQDQSAAIEEKIKKIGPENFRGLERAVYLQVIDRFWVDHLNAMEDLRAGIGLRGYSQTDPLVIYKNEAYQMFERLLKAIEQEVIGVLVRIEIQAAVPPRPEPTAPQLVLQGASEDLAGGAISHAGAGMVVEREAPIPAATAEAESAESTVSKVAEDLMGESKSSGGVTVTVRKAGEVSQSSNARPFGKVGRNEPCPCGSGKKFKKCHGA